MKETCMEYQEDYIIRNYFAFFSWMLKLFTIFIFVATIHLHKHIEQQRELQVQERHPRAGPRRVLYRGMAGRGARRGRQ